MWIVKDFFEIFFMLVSDYIQWAFKILNANILCKVNLLNFRNSSFLKTGPYLALKSSPGNGIWKNSKYSQDKNSHYSMPTRENTVTQLSKGPIKEPSSSLSNWPHQRWMTGRERWAERSQVGGLTTQDQQQRTKYITPIHTSSWNQL